MTQLVGKGVEPVLQEDHFRDLVDPFLYRRVTLECQRTEHGAAARIGDLEILEHGEIFEHRRRLEFAADAGLHDLVLLQLRQLLAAKLDRPGGGSRLAADQIEHRGLAGAVGADDDADLVLLDIEGQIIDRLESVEGNGERFDREQKFLGLVTDEHDLSPHSAGAPSATELSLQPFLGFGLRDASSRSMRGCT